MSLPLNCTPRYFTDKTELITMCCSLNWLGQIYFLNSIARTLQGFTVTSAKLCKDPIATRKQVIQ